MSLLKQLLFSMLVGCCWMPAIAQNEYRITEEGDYQFLSGREEAGMVYDESKGSYYKNITIRTFYLETYRRGYLPKQISFPEFSKLTKEEQRGLLRQPFDDIYDCSVDNPSAECLGYEKAVNRADESSKGIRIDLDPTCTAKDARAKSQIPSLSSKLLMDPNDRRVQNVDCGDEPGLYTKPPAIQSSATIPNKMPSTINVLLDKK